MRNRKHASKDEKPTLADVVQRFSESQRDAILALVASACDLEPLRRELRAAHLPDDPAEALRVMLFDNDPAIALEPDATLTDVPIDNLYNLIRVYRAKMESRSKYAAGNSDNGNFSNRTSPPTPGYLNLIVNRERRTVGRRGCAVTVELTEAEWSIFQPMFDAGAAGIAKAVAQHGYRGDADGIGMAKSRLKEKLEPLAVTIEARGWRLMDDGTT
jgi:hypothetical protein